MIFVTVGSELPFDRMIRPIDDWAADHPDIPVFAQTGTPGINGYQPKNMQFTPLLNPQEYQQQIDASSLIIAHAGMGSIITALKTGKPLVIMPRREKFMETRNDHQVGTGKRFNDYASIFYADDEKSMGAKIDEAMTWLQNNQELEKANAFASPELLQHIEDFIFAPRN